jgi:hypothetical protein
MKFATAVAVLALSTIQADAFMVKPYVTHGTNTRDFFSLNALPTKIKKGEKVETDVDAGGLVQALVSISYKLLSLLLMRIRYRFCEHHSTNIYYFSVFRGSWGLVSSPWESLSLVHKTVICQE